MGIELRRALLLLYLFIRLYIFIDFYVIGYTYYDYLSLCFMFRDIFYTLVIHVFPKGIFIIFEY